jgi:hypothetical protein
MFTGAVALPLFSFNVGIELGQITVLTLALVLLTAADRAMAAAWPARGLRARAMATSLVAAVWAAAMAVQRSPW